MENGSRTGRWRSRALWAAVGAAAALAAPEAQAAGTVTTVVSGGRLTVTGDDSSNVLDMFVSGNSLYISPTSNTTVSGPTTVPLADFSAIEIRLGGGDDVVNFSGPPLTGEVIVDGGAGNDTIVVQNVNGASLAYTGGEGDENVTFRSCVFNGAVTLDPGAGGGDLELDRVQVVGDLTADLRALTSSSHTLRLLTLPVAGRTTIRAGNTGRAIVEQSLCTFAGLYTFLGGSGDDSLSSAGDGFDAGFDVRGGAGDDDLRVNCRSTGVSSKIRGDAGDDTVEWSATTADTRRAPRVNVSINTAAGADSVRIAGEGVVATGTVSVVTGGGNDLVEVYGLAAPKLTVTQGGGTDELRVLFNQIQGAFSPNGGGARDTLRGYTDGQNTFGGGRPKSYETKTSADV